MPADPRAPQWVDPASSVFHSELQKALEVDATEKRNEWFRTSYSGRRASEIAGSRDLRVGRGGRRVVCETMGSQKERKQNGSE
ncbi:hypothetical protein HPP92_004708 [Vanilla planifolia]|uniref:Uncharacterized protein n=1 Tax=Vanilla planifolia TaxID=51239 RepID=A0A835RN75_VANPL|nr:hypothetical protein HPP92_004708 [Vanilla planifolia]